LFIAKFKNNPAIAVAGGGFGITAASVAFYTGAAGLLSPDASYFTLPVLDISHRD